MSKKKAKSSQKKGNDKKKPANKKVAKKNVTKTSGSKKAKVVAKAKKVVTKSKPAPAKKNKITSKKSTPLPAGKAGKKQLKPAAKPAKKKVAAKAKPLKKTASKKAVKKVVKKVAPKKVVKPIKKAIVKAKPVKKAPAPKVVAKPAKAIKPVKEKVVAKPTPKAEVKAVKKEVKPAVEVKVAVVKSTPVSNLPKVTVPEKQLPEPKGKYELEYVIHSSTSILFEFLTSPSGLSEWFCDDVNIRNDIYTFFWDGSQQQARLIKFIEEKLVRYQMVDKADGVYFEFRIERDELTNDISLIVSDFADSEDEKASSKLLWDSQIDKLLHVLGSYF